MKKIKGERNATMLVDGARHGVVFGFNGCEVIQGIPTMGLDRNAMRELRDHLSTLLGETGITGVAGGVGGNASTPGNYAIGAGGCSGGTLGAGGGGGGAGSTAHVIVGTGGTGAKSDADEGDA